MLLTEDVIIKKERKEGGEKFLEVKLKCSKENKTGKAVLIEVYESGGTLCPVKAFGRWKTKTTSESGLPAFRETDGTPLTGQNLTNGSKTDWRSTLTTGKGSSLPTPLG